MAKHSYAAILTLAISTSFLALACGSDPAQQQKNEGGSGGTTVPIVRPGEGGSGGDGGGGGDGGSGGNEARTLRLDSVHPARGHVAGGEAVVLKGQGFIDKAGRPDSASTTVLFGSNPAIGVRVVDDTTINLRTPVGLEGETSITITNLLGESVCTDCFRYLGTVELRSIEPGEGPLSGGTPITISGTGLREGMVITVGERAAIDVEFLGDGRLRAILPPANGEGTVDVRAFDAEGQAWLRKGFVYVDRVSIDEVDPPGGPLVGGNRIEIRGRGFTNSAVVSIDGVPAQTNLEETGLLSVLVPSAAEPGAVELLVETQAGSATATYAYFDPAETTPQLYAITPQQGPLAGGTEVTLVGTGLDQGLLAVRFDGTLAHPATASSANIVRVTTPPGNAPLVVDVEARVATGADQLPGAFRYLAPIEITEITPASGPTAGGTSIVVKGVALPEGARLFIGALEAQNVMRVSPTLLTATTPRGSVGRVPVRVSPPAGHEGEAILVDGFTYEGELGFSVIEPTTGARAGGSLVTLRGTGFYSGMPVSFGAALAPEVEIRDPFTAVVKTPPGNTGTVDVTVGPQDGVHVTRAQAFTYMNPSSSTGGASGGPLNGTLNVTVLNGHPDFFGQPLEGARVVLGSDDGAELEGFTDVRGQVTISSPLLVKPQVVTASLYGFEAATVAKQQSENLTLLLEQIKFPPSEPPDPPDPPPVGIVRGKVWGFKKPANRELRPVEREVAQVTVSYANIFSAPPFGRESEPLLVTEEGGEFAFAFARARALAVSAVYGILDESTGRFEPLLMGVARGVEIEIEATVEADIVLDMRLDMDVPFTLVNSQPGGTEVFGYVDLGAEGVIPVGEVMAWGATGKLQGLPRLAGENFLFQTWSYQNFPFYPFSVFFRRQAGDLTKGLTIGPMMGSVVLNRPSYGSYFNGVLEWSLTPGPAPEIAVIYFRIRDKMTGENVPYWHMVLPGTERRLTVPTAALADLRSQFGPGEPMIFDVVIQVGREPLFGFDQWTYGDTSLSAYTSFAYFMTQVEL